MNEDDKLLKDKEFYEEVSKEAIKKKKRERPDKTAQLEDGDNTKYLKHALKFFELPKCNMNDPDEVWERTLLYFQACADDDMKPGIVGYANALGISRVELYNVMNEKRGNGLAVNTLKKAKSIIEQQMESYMTNGKINPVSGIFLLKNNFQQYTDKQEIEVKAVPVLGDETTPEEIAQKYMESLPGNVE